LRLRLQVIAKVQGFRGLCPHKKQPHFYFLLPSVLSPGAAVNQAPSPSSNNPSLIIRPSRRTPLAVFDASHGQPNWAQTGFSSREMHTNYAGVMELLCRLGCICAPTGLEPLPELLSRARLLVIPPSTGCYNSARKCWLPQPEARFTAENIRDVLQFVQEGGRLLAFAYRFGDSFTNSNLRELISPLGCLLNDDAVVDLQLLRNTHPLEGAVIGGLLLLGILVGLLPALKAYRSDISEGLNPSS